MPDTTKAFGAEVSIGWFVAEPLKINGVWHAQVRDPHQPTEESRRVAISLDREELARLLALIDDAESDDRTFREV